MMCPAGIVSEVSALQAVKVGDRAQYDVLHEGRDGAGDESTGSDYVAIDASGTKIYVKRRSTDSRAQSALRQIQTNTGW